MDIRKRDSAFQKLVPVTAEHGLGHFIFDMLKKRIKATKTVYGTELMKVNESKKSEASCEEISKQILSWFTTADALNDITMSRKSTCNLVCLN
jgi:hypothetical protein